MTTIVGTPPGVTASGYKKPPPPVPVLTDLVGWWDADDASTFTYSSGVIITQWRDKSGGAHHAAQTGQSFPTLAAAAINGRSSVRFEQLSPTALSIPAFMGSYVAAELFMVARLYGAAGTILDKWGTSTSASWYPYSDNHIYENWGTTSRPDLGLINKNTLDAAHIYNIRTSPGSYVAALNRTVFYTSAAIGTQFRSTGNYEMNSATLPDRQGYWMGEFMVYSRVLSASERTQQENYLRTKWGTP